MGETTNIAAMAELISNEVFLAFGWKAVGPRNEQWECAREDHAAGPAKKKAKASSAGTEPTSEASADDPTPKAKRSHPSDVVFRYSDPYRDGLIFVQTDLKSYGGDSIKKDEVAGAVRSLCMGKRRGRRGSRCERRGRCANRRRQIDGQPHSPC